MATSKENGDRLRTLIDELNERVFNLKCFDRAYEINAYCDDLVSEVTLVTESAIENLNEAQTSLVNEINKYRSDRLLAIKEEETQADREREEAFTRHLEVLIQDIDALCRQSDQLALTNARDLEARAKELRIQLRNQTFKYEFLLFKQDQAFVGKILTGELIKSHKDPGEMRFNFSVLDDNASQAISANLANKKFDQTIHRLLFLQDGNLAVSIRDRPLLIWSPQTKQTLFELDEDFRYSSVYLMTQLPSGRLATADSVGFIDVWDLETRRHVAAFAQQKTRVTYLSALPNGCLASFINYLDKKIIIWKAASADETRWTRALLIDASDVLFELRVLQNGNLAFTYVDHSDNDYNWLIAAVVSSENGKMIQRMSLPKVENSDIKQRVFLPDGEILTRLEDGTVEIIGKRMDEKRHYLTEIVNFNKHGQLVKTIQRSSHTIEFVCVKSLSSFFPSSSREARNETSVSCSCVSQDGKLVALGTSNGGFVVVPLKN